MKTIPVLDLMHGQVVRGKAGRRQEYRPIVSSLTSSYLPIEVARAFRDHFGLSELYLADLDAIAGAAPALQILDDLRQDGFSCWVDAGIHQLAEAMSLAQHADTVIAGLETLSGPSAWAEISSALGRRAIFSLDLKDSAPLGNSINWGSDSRAIAEIAVRNGATRMIVLDISSVGMERGTGTGELCRHLRLTHPQLELVAGGGIRDRDDLRRLADDGMYGVLLASALHDLTFKREDLMDAAPHAR